VRLCQHRPGNKLTADQQKAKLERIVEVAREAWG
jgi:hypothetical protein